MLNDYNEILTIKDVQKILHISRGSVQKLIDSGRLNGFMVSDTMWRITKEELEKFIMRV